MNATNPKFAWSQIDRAALPKRPAVERVADFLDIYSNYDEATAPVMLSLEWHVPAMIELRVYRRGPGVVA